MMTKHFDEKKSGLWNALLELALILPTEAPPKETPKETPRTPDPKHPRRDRQPPPARPPPYPPCEEPCQVICNGEETWRPAGEPCGRVCVGDPGHAGLHACAYHIGVPAGSSHPKSSSSSRSHRRSSARSPPRSRLLVLRPKFMSICSATTRSLALPYKRIGSLLGPFPKVDPPQSWHSQATCQALVRYAVGCRQVETPAFLLLPPMQGETPASAQVSSSWVNYRFLSAQVWPLARRTSSASSTT